MGKNFPNKKMRRSNVYHKETAVVGVPSKFKNSKLAWAGGGKMRGEGSPRVEKVLEVS